jgi:DDE superfamily endonuclease
VGVVLCKVSFTNGSSKYKCSTNVILVQLIHSGIYVHPFLSLVLILYHIWQQVDFDNRYMSDNGSTCKITVDGTDCPIREPTNFSGRWYSHKFKGAGLRYEVGVCIQTGWIVWKNGPYPCGSWPDLRIARDKLVHYLVPGEKFIADRGYRDGGVYADTPTGYNNICQRMKSIVRARHETVNARIKNYKILSTRFRNTLDKHYMAFHAIINILQVEIENGSTLYQVYYNDKVVE